MDMNDPLQGTELDLCAQSSVPQSIDWDALYADQMPRVYNFMRYRVGDGPVAEDLTSATFEKAWRARSQYRRDKAAFSTWLFTIARNVAVDYFRRQRPVVLLASVSEQPDGTFVEETVQRGDDLARLGALLARLPGRERELISLKYGAGLTNRSIARLTGLSESNVGTILYRVVRRLRAQWETEQ
jgi:RNA polymerase sigma-70 factor (ECF subfamily)